MKAKKRTAKRSPKQLSIETRRSSTFDAVMPWILGILGCFLILCIILGDSETGLFGKWFLPFFKGLLSIGAYPLPIFLIIHAIFYKRDLAAGSQGYKFFFTFGAVAFLGVLCALINKAEPSFNIADNYTLGKALQGGGVIGGFFYASFIKLIGNAATWILTIICIIVLTTFIIGKSPKWLYMIAIAPAIESIRESRFQRKQRRMELKEYEEQEKMRLAEERANEKYDIKKKKPELDPVIDDVIPEDVLPDGEERIILPIEEEKSRFVPIEDISPEPPPTIKQEINDIFGGEVKGNEDDEIAQASSAGSASGSAASDDEEITEKKSDIDTSELIEDAEAEIPEYIYPPINLLNQGKAVSQSDMREQEQTAKKLVETLASFGVKTTIIGVSKGPTITRYELQPQPGVRVRSITNLSDDIALALAASGVRIEAPIPGKEAVGIEVPNKIVDTVYLRTLIENEKFAASKSKLYGCLGMDVAGKPVFCDIAKMPHMLVAGATGMGKSVCMNSLIMSILYHASPEEVQMMLIDPKKVEMGVYNRLPHLIVPVVTDPKKAAGALSWAVIEMEKRFIEMEEVGVRDIGMYNEVTKGDPDKKPMPQVVIFIDELADLMMTARDEVETSICRIAQKARAAGMHLVIGTQRPSVDVVTGLIKANVPSRIALTVASQVDSRTIIDIQGAEKLIGRGDMLYAPVGAIKPMRVQGCFVSEKEIQAVCDFIRKERTAEYDEQVSNLIEREANKCGEKKKNAIFTIGGEEDPSGGLFADKDPILDKAIDIAIAENKVSTSLLQRKLSVGYARAAKLIDFMADMGVVGEYAGSKPREVLWTQEFYSEYKMKAHDGAEKPVAEKPKEKAHNALMI